MKSIGTIFAVSAIAMGTMIGAVSAQTFTIGSNPQGTLYYTVGSALAAAIETSAGTRTIVQPFTGSSVYLPLLPSGEVTIGISNALDFGRAYSDPANPIKELRALARIYTTPYGYLVSRSSGITDYAGLKGKPIARDLKAQLSLTSTNTALLAAGGLKESDYEQVTIGNVQEGLGLLVEGKVAATATIPGSPQSQQTHATIPGGIRYLSLEDTPETNKILGEIAPGLSTFNVEPGEGMPSIDAPVTMIGLHQFLVVGESLPDEDVKKILTAVWEAWPRLQQDVPSLRSATVEEMASPINAAPYHPAAIAFFKEKGIWSEANEAQEGSFAK